MWEVGISWHGSEQSPHQPIIQRILRIIRAGGSLEELTENSLISNRTPQHPSCPMKKSSRHFFLCLTRPVWRHAFLSEPHIQIGHSYQPWSSNRSCWLVRRTESMRCVDRKIEPTRYSVSIPDVAVALIQNDNRIGSLPSFGSKDFCFSPAESFRPLPPANVIRITI